MKKLGIENLKIIIGTGLEFQQAATAALEDDGKIDFVEGMSFLPQLTKIPNTVEAAKKAPAEFLDLDDSEKAELSQYFSKRFDIVEDKIEEAIELSFEYALDTASYVLKMQRLLKKKIA